jgi:hypothetical protein
MKAIITAVLFAVVSATAEQDILSSYFEKLSNPTDRQVAEAAQEDAEWWFPYYKLDQQHHTGDLYYEHHSPADAGQKFAELHALVGKNAENYERNFLLAVKDLEKSRDK